MLVTVSDTAADQEPAAAEDTAAVDDLIRTLVRMGLDQQTYFVTEAVERLEQAIESGTAGDVETEARDVMTDAQNLYDMACAVAVRGYLGQFVTDETKKRRTRRLDRHQGVTVRD
jgi:hypothetical protein